MFCLLSGALLFPFIRLYSTSSSSNLYITFQPFENSVNVFLIIYLAYCLVEPIAALCSDLSHHWDVSVAATAIQIRTLLAKWYHLSLAPQHGGKESPTLSYSQIISAAQNVIIQCLAEETQPAVEALKVLCVFSLWNCRGSGV